MKLQTRLLLGALIPIILITAVVIVLTNPLLLTESGTVQESYLAVITVILAVLSLIAAGLLYVVGRDVFEGISNLEKGARRATTGHLEEVTGLRGNDEIARLGTVFNEMIGDLRGYLRLIDDYKDLQARLDRSTEATELLRRSSIDISDSLERLHRAQELLVEDQRMHVFGQMFAGISQDMDQALETIVQKASLDESDLSELSKKTQDDYVTIQSNAELVRLELGKLVDFHDISETEASPIGLAAVVDESVALSRIQWQHNQEDTNRKVEVNIDCDPSFTVRGRHLDLVQMIVALLVNASEAMPHGGGIVIRAKKNNDRIGLEIVDQGIGMNRDVMRRCWRPFFTTKDGGAGIGLPMAAGIARRNSGKIGLVSEEGEGTTIFVEFPAVEPRSTESEAAAEKKLAVGLKILLVDDDFWTRDILTRGLAASGHVVTSAANGAEALLQFDRAPCDVLITDRAMPGMTGEELALAVRQRNPSIPIILITGCGDLINTMGTKPDQVDAVLGKPLTATAINHVLSGLVAAVTPEQGP